MGQRGLEPPEAIWSDLGFIEMFEHASRFIVAAEGLRYVTLGVGTPNEMPPLADLSAVHDAHARTLEMQVIIIAMLEGPTVLRRTLGRQPTSADLARHATSL